MKAMLKDHSTLCLLAAVPGVEVGATITVNGKKCQLTGGNGNTQMWGPGVYDAIKDLGACKKNPVEVDIEIVS